MAIDRVKAYFRQYQMEESFQIQDQVILIVAAGDAKIDNAKYKAQFHTKAKMLHAEEVETKIGHNVGGVCPFGINEGVDVCK